MTSPSSAEYPGAHEKGNSSVEALANLVPLDVWGYGAETLNPSSPLLKRYHGPAWGLAMFSIFSQSLMTINRHIDVAENYANNMRPFEATGLPARF